MVSTRKSRSVNRRFSKVYEEPPNKNAGNGNINQQRKRKLLDMLGSQWNKEELGRFYGAYRKYGKDWKKVAGVVRSRSVEMVEALYHMNRAYLSLPDGMASVDGLIAMMTDQYNILELQDVSESERESNDGLGTSQKPPQCGSGKLQHSISKGLDGQVPDLLHSQSFVSSYGCQSLLKKRCSGGSRSYGFGKRTPRIPVSYPCDKDGREKCVSPNIQGPKSDIDFDFDEGAHGAALALAEALQRGGCPHVSQTPNRSMEDKRRSPVYNVEECAESEMVSTKLIGTAMDEDCWGGSSGSREAENGDFSQDTNGLGTIEVHRKGKKFRGKKLEIQKIENNHLDDVGGVSSGFDGLDLRSVKEKVGTEVTNTKNELFSHPDQRRKSRQLFIEDESAALEALRTLAEISTKLATSAVESESHVQFRVQEGTFDVDKSNIPQRMLVNHKKDKPKSSVAKEKENHMDGVSITTHKNVKLGTDSALNVSALSQVKKRPHQLSSKMHKGKHKSLASKLQVSKDELHGDSPLGEPQMTKGSAERGKKFMKKPKCVSQSSPHIKQGKSVKPPECYSNAELPRAGKNSAVSVVKVSTVNQVNLPTKLRSRRKMNLQKALVHELKSSENIGNDQPKYSSHDLEEKLSHCLSSPMLRKWCAFEWFYSAIDYPWFSKSEFVEFLNHLGFGRVPRLTRAEWGFIRSLLGKTRRLSHKYLSGERETLEEHRESVRTTNIEVQSRTGDVIPTDLAWPLSVGKRVIACHPKTREIHDGSILTVDRNRCRVQFDRPELGVEFLMDIDCMPVNSVENMIDAFRRQNITVDEVHEPLNIQPKDWKIGGYIKCAPKETMEKADDPSHVPCIVNTLSREAKELLVLEQRRMNDEVLKNQKDGDNSLKDCESFKEDYGAVYSQIKEANNQVCSALQNLRKRNTNHGNSPPPCWKAVASSGGPAELLSSFDHSMFFTQEAVSNVIEIVESSRCKAQTMVDVAVQSMSSLKEGEDVFGEVVDSANSRHSGTNSGVLAIRSFTPQVPGCDSACQDQANSCTYGPTGIVHATVSNPNMATEQNEVQIPTALISSCVATFLMIQKCTERQYPPDEVALILDSAVSSLQPCCSENLSIYRDIQWCMGMVKNQIVALVPP